MPLKNLVTVYLFIMCELYIRLSASLVMRRLAQEESYRNDQITPQNASARNAFEDFYQNVASL